MRNMFPLIPFAVLFAFCAPAAAHHAMAYIEIESYTTAKKGQSVLHLHYDYIVENRDDADLDHWEFTPGWSYGVTDRLMSDVHFHYAGFGDGHLDAAALAARPSGIGPFIEAAALVLQYRVTDGAPVNAAVSARFEMPSSRSRDLLGGREVVAGTLILSRDLGEHSNVTVNFTYGSERGDEIKSWAAGIKTPLTSDPAGIAGGVEYLADFKGDYSVMPGLYAPLTDSTTLKTGLEFGRRNESSRMNLTLMYRF